MISLYKSIFLFLAVTFCDSAARSQHKSGLKVNADAPTILVSTRDAGNNFMTLPSLNYKLAIDKQCMAGFTPTVLSLSVADTRQSFDADALSKTETLDVELTIPEEQIGPISVEQFCVRTEVEAEDRNADIKQFEVVHIPAVLSLQASLLCANELESRIVYVSASLDVALKCRKSEPPAPAAQ